MYNELHLMIEFVFHFNLLESAQHKILASSGYLFAFFPVTWNRTCSQATYTTSGLQLSSKKTFKQLFLYLSLPVTFVAVIQIF